MTNTNAQRAKVWHGNLDKTSGGLKKEDLMMNSNGKIVSKKASKAAKKNKNLGVFEKSKNSSGFELSPKKGSKDYKDFKKVSTKRKSKIKKPKKSKKPKSKKPKSKKPKSKKPKSKKPKGNK